MIVLADDVSCGRIAIEGICGKMKKVRWPIVALVAALIGLVWYASLPVSTGPAAGTSLNGEAVRRTAADEAGSRRATICLGTFNIHGGRDRQKRGNLDRVAAELGDLDFVALNEVAGRTVTGGPDQAEQLAQRLGLQWLFAPADRRWFLFQSGNGAISRLPARSWQRLPLPRRYDPGYRNMVLVDLQCGYDLSSTVHVLLTHVNQRYDAEREAQLRAVIALYLALAEPAVLMGDLNSDANDPQIRMLLETPGVVNAVGARIGAKDLPGRIDWIIARGLHPIAAGIRENGASDHPLVWAELELPAEQSAL